MSLFDFAAGDETWSVAELTAYIADLVESDVRLRRVRVEGEISNFTRARSGHLYFTLKDAEAQIRCVMWRSAAERLRLRPRDGDAVRVDGRVAVYQAGGNYQLYAERITPLGIGDLAAAFEALKQRLAEEGLFDEAHKQPIPALPRKLGVVTSADAAALRDILTVLKRRFPAVEVLIAPTLVQGPDAPRQIVRALQWLDGRHDIDAIIVARGGGSIEDLWAFNDENVARAIFNAHHPVISGVGHEVDFTIADFVADLRAPTPTAAAELAVPDSAELRGFVEAAWGLLRRGLQRRLLRAQERLAALKSALNLLGPQAGIDSRRQQVDALTWRLDQALARRLAADRSRLAVASARLTAVSPRATLARGYAIVRRADGRLVRSVADVADGDDVAIELADGEVTAVVQDTTAVVQDTKEHPNE